MLALFAAVTLFALARGTFDHLSVMREYAVNAGRFAHDRLVLLDELGERVGVELGVASRRSVLLR